jgi:hypothetical protein
MRFYAPLDDGDSATRPPIDLDLALGQAVKTAVSETSFVHGNMRLEGMSGHAFDSAALERRARAARSAWVGSKLKSYYQALVDKFERAGRSELENYLAASENLADLEDRIRRFERHPASYY